MTNEAADRAFREACQAGVELPLMSSVEIWREAWQACESLEHKPMNQCGGSCTHPYACRSDSTGAALICIACKFQDERVRAAVAEMREKARLEALRVAGKHNINHEIADRIDALPLDGDPHWLEKQLLDVRGAQYQECADHVHILNMEDSNWWRQRSDQINAKRRALDA